MQHGRCHFRVAFFAGILGVFACAVARGQDDADSVQAIVRSAGPSIVVIESAGRDGRVNGLGTGFVVGPEGVIATSLHVIGQGRPVRVRFADAGGPVEATAVVAVDRRRDLALIQVERRDAPALELGDSDVLLTGDPVVVLGHPLGFERSVVAGVLSARRAIDGRDMLQLAVPIERGNSGGPVLDRTGRVVGVVTAKSTEGPNIGFAVPVNALRPLLEKPRPIAMDRWLTIGALDEHDWAPRMGGTWRQRAGRIVASGSGDGFGGRMVCLSTLDVPDSPFELAVDVRLDDESGAAGLVFHSDGGDRHYGFYPTNGALRLTRFAGPDVFSWTILDTVPHSAYRPGRWNTIKVRVDGDRITGFVNDRQVIEATDDALETGRIGLVKFRDPGAEFKRFRIAPSLGPSGLPDDAATKILTQADRLSDTRPPCRDIIEALTPHGSAGLEVLRRRADALEAEAFRLRHLADLVHVGRVQQALQNALDRDESEIDLIEAALRIAELDNEDLEIDIYQRRVSRMADEIRASLPQPCDDDDRLQAITRFMFDEWGFRGSRADYYHRSNSYLNEVLDDREGLPITLSIVFIELARRLELPVVGVGLPGHFVVRYVPASGDARLIDVYEGGEPMTLDQARVLVRLTANVELRDDHLRPTTKREIIVRMLRNLTGMAERERDVMAVLRYVDAMLAVAPDSAIDRWTRAVLRFRTGQTDAAAEDLDWLIQHEPSDVDLRQVRELREVLRATAR